MALAQGGDGLDSVKFKLLMMEAALREQKELFVIAALASIADAICGSSVMQQRYNELFGTPLESIISAYREVADKWKIVTNSSPSTT